MFLANLKLLNQIFFFVILLIIFQQRSILCLGLYMIKVEQFFLTLLIIHKRYVRGQIYFKQVDFFGWYIYWFWFLFETLNIDSKNVWLHQLIKKLRGCSQIISAIKRGGVRTIRYFSDMRVILNVVGPPYCDFAIYQCTVPSLVALNYQYLW